MDDVQVVEKETCMAMTKADNRCKGVPMANGLCNKHGGVSAKDEEKIKNKKELLVFPVPGSALYGIRYAGGGQLPGYLSGKYTCREWAARAIGEYLDGQSSSK